MKRRRFLQTSLAASAGLTSFPIAAAGEPPATRIIDTHTHFYDPVRRQGVPWPDKGSPLYRTVLPDDWKKVASPFGVKETVVVEASKWTDDNPWILNLAAQEKCIVGFVGNLEPMDADFTELLKRYAANHLFRGIRRSGDFLFPNIARPEFRKGMKQLADLGLELDVNNRIPGGLQMIAQLAADIPDLRIVVDHVGSAGDPQKLDDDWKVGMKALGARKNVFCKVSALIEQTDQSTKKYGSAPPDTAYYAPVLDHCWECFGADRLVYGSNWPVSEKGGSYGDEFKIVSEYFGAKGREACEKYFWRNSLAAYRWIGRA